MDAATLEALKKSIEHWENNVRAKYPEDASVHGEDCALCEMFAENSFCEGCPVAEFGFIGCGGSPWDKAYFALRSWRRGSYKFKPVFRTAAQAELDFLKSLLPEEKVDG